MKKAIWLMAIFSFIILAGCETTKGLGRDIENTGANVEEGFGHMWKEGGETSQTK